MIHNLPWFIFPFKNVWGGGGRPAPPHPFILQNCAYAITSSSMKIGNHIMMNWLYFYIFVQNYVQRSVHMTPTTMKRLPKKANGARRSHGKNSRI